MVTNQYPPAEYRVDNYPTFTLSSRQQRWQQLTNDIAIKRRLWSSFEAELIGLLKGEMKVSGGTQTFPDSLVGWVRDKWGENYIQNMITEFAGVNVVSTGGGSATSSSQLELSAQALMASKNNEPDTSPYRFRKIEGERASALIHKLVTLRDIQTEITRLSGMKGKENFFSLMSGEVPIPSQINSLDADLAAMGGSLAWRKWGWQHPMETGNAVTDDPNQWKLTNLLGDALYTSWIVPQLRDATYYSPVMNGEAPLGAVTRSEGPYSLSWFSDAGGVLHVSIGKSNSSPPSGNKLAVTGASSSINLNRLWTLERAGMAQVGTIFIFRYKVRLPDGQTVNVGAGFRADAHGTGTLQQHTGGVIDSTETIKYGKYNAWVAKAGSNWQEFVHTKALNNAKIGNARDLNTGFTGIHISASSGDYTWPEGGWSNPYANVQAPFWFRARFHNLMLQTGVVRTPKGLGIPTSYPNTQLSTSYDNIDLDITYLAPMLWFYSKAYGQAESPQAFWGTHSKYRLFARQEEHQFIDPSGTQVGRTVSVVYLVLVDAVTGAPKNKGIPIGTYSTTPVDAISKAKKFYPYLLTIKGGNNPRLPNQLKDRYKTQMLDAPELKEWVERDNKGDVRYAVVVKSEWDWPEHAVAPKELYQYILNVDDAELGNLINVLRVSQSQGETGKVQLNPNVMGTKTQGQSAFWYEYWYRRHEDQGKVINMRIMHMHALAFSPQYQTFFENQRKERLGTSPRQTPVVPVATQAEEVRNLILAPFHGWSGSSKFGKPKGAQSENFWGSSHKDGWHYMGGFSQNGSLPWANGDVDDLSFKNMLPPYLQNVVLTPVGSAHQRSLMTVYAVPESVESGIIQAIQGLQHELLQLWTDVRQSWLQLGNHPTASYWAKGIAPKAASPMENYLLKGAAGQFQGHDFSQYQKLYNKMMSLKAVVSILNSPIWLETGQFQAASTFLKSDWQKAGDPTSYGLAPFFTSKQIEQAITYLNRATISFERVKPIYSSPINDLEDMNAVLKLLKSEGKLEETSGELVVPDLPSFSIMWKGEGPSSSPIRTININNVEHKLPIGEAVLVNKASSGSLQAPLHEWAKTWGRPFAPNYMIGQIKSSNSYATIVSRRVPIGTKGISGKFYGKSSRVALLSNQLVTDVPGVPYSFQLTDKEFSKGVVTVGAGIVALTLGAEVFKNILIGPK